MPKIIVGIIAIALVGVAGSFWLYQSISAPVGEINSFDDCAAAGYPVMESYPRQCRIPGGEAFVEDIGNELEKIDVIRVDSPRPNQTISSPLIIQGEARGTWFFEGDFPVYLLDDNGKELKIGIARAKSDSMTESFVRFEAKIEFQQPKTKIGALIFKKDNPSGLIEHDDELRMPIHF